MFSGVSFNPFGIGPDRQFTPPTDGASWLCCVKTSIKAAANLSATARSVLWDPASNTFVMQSSAATNDSTGEFILQPSDVGGLGCIIGVFDKVSQTAISSNPSGVNSAGGLLTHGQSPAQTLQLYALGLSGVGNYVQQVPGAVWSLTNITGGIVQADLSPSADGLSAVFTANHAGTCYVTVSYNGLPVTRFYIFVQ